MPSLANMAMDLLHIPCTSPSQYILLMFVEEDKPYHHDKAGDNHYEKQDAGIELRHYTGRRDTVKQKDSYQSTGHKKKLGKKIGF